MGRWTTPDWSAKEEPVPYAKLDDPQSLNLYNYVGNNPLSKADTDGHCWPFCLALAGGGILAEEAPLALAGPIGWGVIGASALVIGGTAIYQHLHQTPAPAASAPTAEAAKPKPAPPNPNGSKGSPDHQATADEEAAKMGENGQREVRIPTPGGAKGTRVADAATVEGGKVTAVTQVIRPKKNGAPPKREVEAAKDIKNATGVEPKLVPVRPLPR